MADTDGSIAIQINLSVDEAEKELTRLKGRFTKLQGEMTENRVRKTALEKQLEEVSAQLDAIREKNRGVIPGRDENAQALLQQTESINAEIDKTDAALRDIEITLDGVKTRYGEVATQAAQAREATQAQGRQINIDNAVRGNETTIGTFVDGQQVAWATRLEETAARLIGYFTNVKTLLADMGQTIGSTVLSGLKQIPALLGSALKSAGSLVRKLASGFVDIGRRVLSATRNLFGFNSAGRSGIPIFARLGSMIKNAFVFNVISQGLNAAKQGIWEYLQANTQFMNALSQLKGTLSGAFQPILDVIVPALTKLVGWLTSAAEAVGRFIAALFGKSFKVVKTGTTGGGTGSTGSTGSSSAKQNVEDMEEETDALTDVGEAAKEAEKSLMGFDEINQLAAEDAEDLADKTKNPTGAGDDGLGGGGVGGLGGETGSVMDLGESPFESWGEAFSAFLDEIINKGIPNLRRAFEGFATWFNDFNKKLYDMFTFEGIEEKVIQIGKDLANAFNDLVNWIDWTALGNALGAGLNLALQGLVNFLYTFDWMNLGASLANSLNAMISQIDWTAMGQLLWAKFKIALDMLAGFLLNLDMVEIAQAATNLITGFFDSMSETIESIDWHQIGEQIKTLLVNIDWAGIAESVAEAFGAAIGAAASIIWDWIQEAWGNIINWWHDVAYEDGEFTVQGLLDGIWDAICNIGEWINEHIFQPFMRGFESVFGISSPSTVMEQEGHYLMQGLLEGILQEFQPILDAVQQIFNGITEFVRGVFAGDWEQAWNGILETFKGVWNGIVSALETAINFVIRGVNTLTQAISNALSFDLPEELGGGHVGINIPQIGEVSLPRLAQGAVIPPNREFMAVLGDQSAGNNLEAPESLIRRIVREESGSGSNDLLREILEAIRGGQVIMVDGTVFGRTAIKSINAVNQTAGRQLLKL